MLGPVDYLTLSNTENTSLEWVFSPFPYTFSKEFCQICIHHKDTHKCTFICLSDLLVPFPSSQPGDFSSESSKGHGSDTWPVLKLLIVVIVLHEPHVSCMNQGSVTGKLPGPELPVLVTLFLLGPHGPQWPLSTHCPSPPMATAGTERRPTINGEYQFQRAGLGRADF